MDTTTIEAACKPMRDALVTHPMYGLITDAKAVDIFMRHHAFCVWDFMSLVTHLQRELTCVEVPWRPARDAVAARLINEVKVGEECDLGWGEQQYLSHFELYRLAMMEQGVAVRGVDLYVNEGQTWAMPPAALRFVKTTLGFLDRPLPAVAAAFAYGRESVIPSMFEPLLAQSDGVFRYYLDRHIQLDGEDHQHKASELVARVCKSDADWQIAMTAALDALFARYVLWTDVAVAIQSAR